MGKVTYTRRADLDLLEIWEHIARDNKNAASNQLRKIADVCKHLADHPGISNARPEIRPGVRTWPVGAYLVLHHEVIGGIEVVRVVHGARDLDSILVD